MPTNNVRRAPTKKIKTFDGTPTEASAAMTRIASENYGVVTRHQLVQLGFTPEHIRLRLNTMLTPFSRGVYVVGEPGRRTWLLAALRSAPEVAASAETAARLIGLPVEKIDAIRLIGPMNVKRHWPAPLELTRSRLWRKSDWTTDGPFRRTTCARTICELSTSLPPDKIQELIEWAITNHKMTKRQFKACVRRWCRKGRAGSGIIRYLDLAILGDEPFPASELEHRGTALLRRAGLVGWVLHFRPPWSNGVTGIVDIAFPDLLIVIELDGRRWHQVTKATKNDRSRDRRANAHGWVVLRFGWQEVVEEPQDTIDEIVEFIHARRRALAA